MLQKLNIDKKERYNIGVNTLFISEMRFPEGNAAGVLRLKNIVAMFKAQGDSVFVLAKGLYTGKAIRNFDEISYISLRSKGNNYISRAFDLYSFYWRVKNFLNISEIKWDKIVIYTVNNKVTEFVKKYAMKHNIKLYIDCDEWYSPEEFKKGIQDKNYKANNKLITEIIDKNFSVIAISSYLKSYFTSKGINAVRIPVTMDMRTIKPVLSRNNEKRLFLYAGSPGGKDPLNKMIDSFRLLSENDKNKVEFWILGVDWTWIKKKYSYTENECNEMSNFVKPFGIVTRDEVVKKLCIVDFTILIRPEGLRYTKAGFPTKVVESLSYGTPVIVNLTSDLGKYIIDGKNGFIVKDCSSEELKIVIEKVIKHKYNQSIYSNARELAEKSFDYRKFVGKLTEIKI